MQNTIAFPCRLVGPALLLLLTLLVLCIQEGLSAGEGRGRGHRENAAVEELAAYMSQLQVYTHKLSLAL